MRMVHVRPCNRVPVRVFAVVNVCLCVRAPVWGLQVTARDSRRTAQRSTSQRTTRRFCCRYRMTLTRTVPQCNAHLTGERALTQCVRKTRVVCARGPCLLRLATRAMGSKRARTRAHAHLRPACGGTRCSVTIVEGHVCNFAIIEWPIPWCVDTPFSASCPSSLHPNRKRYMPSPRPQGPNRTPQTLQPSAQTLHDSYAGALRDPRRLLPTPPAGREAPPPAATDDARGEREDEALWPQRLI